MGVCAVLGNLIEEIRVLTQNAQDAIKAYEEVSVPDNLRGWVRD